MPDVQQRPFFIRILVPIEQRLGLLLRGLLTIDRTKRWQWKEVREWLAGETPPVLDAGNPSFVELAAPDDFLVVCAVENDADTGPIGFLHDAQAIGIACSIGNRDTAGLDMY